MFRDRQSSNPRLTNRKNPRTHAMAEIVDIVDIVGAQRDGLRRQSAIDSLRPYGAYPYPVDRARPAVAHPENPMDPRMPNPTHAMADIVDIVDIVDNVGAQRVDLWRQSAIDSLRPYGACASPANRARPAIAHPEDPTDPVMPNPTHGMADNVGAQRDGLRRQSAIDSLRPYGDRAYPANRARPAIDKPKNPRRQA
jgi:hypothetical protein